MPHAVLTHGTISLRKPTNERRKEQWIVLQPTGSGNTGGRGEPSCAGGGRRFPESFARSNTEEFFRLPRRFTGLPNNRCDHGHMTLSTHFIHDWPYCGLLLPGDPRRGIRGERIARNPPQRHMASDSVARRSSRLDSASDTGHRNDSDSLSQALPQSWNEGGYVHNRERQDSRPLILRPTNFSFHIQTH